MIIYRTFDGDDYTHFTSQRRAFAHADKIADNDNCGPNGFVIIEEIEIEIPNRTPPKFVLSLLNRKYETRRVERFYERFAR